MLKTKKYFVRINIIKFNKVLIFVNKKILMKIFNENFSVDF